MIPPFKAAIAFVVVQACAFHVAAQSTVIIDDAAILPLNGSGQYLTLTNSINPSQGRYGLFAVSITPLGGSQFKFSYSGVAEEYALYGVASGTVVDPFFATSTTPLVSNNGVDPGSSLQTFSIGQSRYFGYWDDRPLNGNRIPDVADNYGWALITRRASGLQVSSSATAVGGGIIAGTFTQVPEPSCAALLAIGICVSFATRRRRFLLSQPPNNRTQRSPR